MPPMMINQNSAIPGLNFNFNINPLSNLYKTPESPQRRRIDQPSTYNNSGMKILMDDYTGVNTTSQNSVLNMENRIFQNQYTPLSHSNKTNNTLCHIIE